jgi:hypothetical protein
VFGGTHLFQSYANDYFDDVTQVNKESIVKVNKWYTVAERMIVLDKLIRFSKTSKRADFTVIEASMVFKMIDLLMSIQKISKHELDCYILVAIDFLLKTLNPFYSNFTDLYNEYVSTIGTCDKANVVAALSDYNNYSDVLLRAIGCNAFQRTVLTGLERFLKYISNTKFKESVYTNALCVQISLTTNPIDEDLAMSLIVYALKTTNITTFADNSGKSDAKYIADIVKFFEELGLSDKFNVKNNDQTIVKQIHKLLYPDIVKV